MSEDVHVQPSGSGHDWPRVPLPFNSKRLTAEQIKRVGRALKVPTEAAATEVRVIIEGKLRELGREPKNVQVLVSSSGLSLLDEGEEFMFISVDTEDEESHEAADDGSSHEGSVDETEQLRLELEEARSEIEALKTTVTTLETQVEEGKDRVKRLWRTNCQYLTELDNEVSSRDAEIERLRRQIQEMKSIAPATRNTESVLDVSTTSTGTSESRSRRGKAPPVDPFTGEDLTSTLDDWLPSLQTAATWYSWSEEEKLMQLGGHLRGRARQEWDLLTDEEKATYSQAIQALRGKMEPANKALAAQDFRHISQGDQESVAELIRRLERTFKVAYGRDSMSQETRYALLHGQLQDALKHEIMKAPAVSGAQNYTALCMASRNEEKRLLELRKRQQYRQPSNSSFRPTRQSVTLPGNKNSSTRPHNERQKSGDDKSNIKCYICGKMGHMQWNCKQKRSESGTTQSKKTDSEKPGMKMVSLEKGNTSKSADQMNPLEWLLSDSEGEGEVSLVRVEDKGSKSQLALVEIAGVPANGIVDTGADITIMGPELFKKVASVAKLKKRQLKKADKVPHTYDRREFKLDGRLDLDINFHDKTMNTAVYLKMDAHDNLLLSEGVCRHLGIVTYHPSVSRQIVNQDTTPKPLARSVRVSIVNSVRLAPSKETLVRVRIDSQDLKGSLLLEPVIDFAQQYNGQVQLSESLVHVDDDGCTKVLFTNTSGSTCRLEKGECVGLACEAITVSGEVTEDCGESNQARSTEGSTGCIINRSEVIVQAVTSDDLCKRKRNLIALVAEIGKELPWQERSKLQELLCEHHNVFAIGNGERGETGMIQMEIDTGSSGPKRQPVRRVPFAARQEIARQLRSMQDQGVIHPSASPWASPVVLVRKKDGSLRFCIDYRDLNSVTKSDTFPLPRVDDMLDQLGKAKFFSTLDLASGYWQVQVHPGSQEKTAFVTHQGLYEFSVMPFGLKNAPAVFQRLMQRVLMGLNPEDGASFVSVYLDDIIIYSETLEDHLKHLQLVLQRFDKAGLKLKPSKCHFVCEAVQYLGHTITPEGIKPNSDRVVAVQEYPVPTSVKAVRQFVGLVSYYRRFIRGFAKIAEPLHALTRKDAVFEWSKSCQEAFDTLKKYLTDSPVLAYPNFTESFRLETDACVKGLGAVLSQSQEDGQIHPVAYASRALSEPEKRYAVTELETLAVVWALNHFHAYLYGHDVVVYTDHSAVKAVLETPNPSAKHARWWTKVYGSGVKSMQIVYRSGRENLNADALSRNPQGEAPCPPQEEEVQVATLSSSEVEIQQLLDSDVSQSVDHGSDFGVEQQKDGELRDIINFLRDGSLPDDSRVAKRISCQSSCFALVDGILYFIDPKHDHRKRCAVPSHLRNQILEESHSGPMAGHFAGEKLYKCLVTHWWWQGMYSDVMAHCMSCPQCAIVNAAGHVNRPPLHPIPVSRPFQIVGVDVMDLPLTKSGNRHVVVFQDYLTKFPLVFPVPDQKAVRLAKLLVEEVVPLFGVPESLLSDRGTNLLSHLMTDLCKMLGTKKLNTTAYHPECDGMVERFNRTLKSCLRKHAATYGNQWDKYLYGVLYAYRNTPHESTGEKPSYLLYGMDCRTPTEAAFVPPTRSNLSDVTDYREQVTTALSTARTIAVKNIQKAQKRYKHYYDRKAKSIDYQLGEWVLVRFPADESGKNRKLSRPWHGPYRVTGINSPDISVVKVYYPQDKQITVHQSRVKYCPAAFPAGFYWYGGRQKGLGNVPQWVQNLLSDANGSPDNNSVLEDNEPPSEQLPEDVVNETASKHVIDDESNESDSVVVESESTGTQISDHDRSSSGHYGLRRQPRPSRKMIELQARD